MKPIRNPFVRQALLAASAIITLACQASAGSLTWDGSDTSTTGAQGGTGTWDMATTANWWNGSADAVWPNSGTDNDAVFAGTAGTVTLSSVTANDIAINTTGYILSGASTLTLNGSTPTITVASGASASIGGNTASVIAGSVGLTKSGTGTLVLNGSASHTFTGGVTVKGGGLTLDFTNLSSASNLIAATNGLTLSGGTLTVTGKASGTTTQTFASTATSGGTTVIPISRNGGTSATLNLGQITKTGGGVMLFQPATAWTTTASTTEIAKVTTSVIYNGTTYSVPASGAIYVGAGMLASGAVSTSTRPVQLNSSGQLVIAPSSTAFVATGGSASTLYSFTGNNTLTGAVTNYAVIANNTATSTIALGSNNYTLNGYYSITGNLNTISGTGSLVIGAEKELVIDLTSTGGLTVSSVIADNAGGASNVTIASAGTGTTTFSGANTYTGSTFFNSGTLSIALAASESNSASPSVLGAIPGTATPGKLVFNGGTLSVNPAGAYSMASNRGITVNGGGGTIVNAAAQNLTINSIIAGTGALTLNCSNGSGAIILGGTNTLTGGATLSGSGTIIPTVNAAFGSTGTLTLMVPASVRPMREISP